MAAHQTPAESPGIAVAEQPKDDRNTKIRKLATFLVMIGPDLASEILKTFEAADIREISTAMAKLGMVDFKTQQAILEEFSQLAVQAATSVSGGSQFTKQVLEKSLGSYQANELIQNVAPAQSTSVDTSILQELDPQQFYNLLKAEDPQTIAFVLSYLDPIKCGSVLVLLSPEMRSDVVSRIATMEPIPTEVLAKVLNSIKKRVSTGRMLSSRPGGLQSIGEVIKAMDSTVSRSIITALEEKNPDLSSSLKKILFTFEDLKKLDQMSLQKVLREVESKDLALSLKTASEGLQQAIFAALPKRAAESIRDEIKFMGPVRLKDVEAAQSRITESVQKLEAQGEISIEGGGKSDMV
jgi:flagellar motor switch protein FliG